MLEFVKILVEKIFDLINVEKIVAMKLTGKKSQLGAELFLLYSHLNEVLITGREIVREILSAIEWMEQKKTQGEGDRSIYLRLSTKLKAQSNNIRLVLSDFNRLSGVLDIVDPLSYRDLRAFIIPKSGLIDMLDMLINSNGEAALFFLTGDSVNDLIQRGRALDAREQFEGCGLSLGSSNQNHSILTMLKSKHHAIADIDYVEARRVDVLKTYLEERKPNDSLDALEAILNSLHASLRNNFDIGDILVSVADPRVLGEDLPHWKIAAKARIY